MRVCLVSHPLPIAHGEGPARTTWECATALAAAGHEVHILTAPGPETPRLPGGATVHRVEPSAGPAAVPQAYPTPALRHAMAVYTDLLRLHAEHAFDYIEFPLSGGEGYFALRGKRLLGQFEGAVLGVRLSTPAADRRCENLDSRFDGEAAFADHLETACLREAQLLLSPTRALLELVRDRIEDDAAWPAPVREVIPPPRSPRPTDGSWRPPGAGRGDGVVPTVLFVGPLEARRGVRTFARAAAALLAARSDLRISLMGPDTATAPIGRPMRAFLEARHGLSAGERCAIDTEPGDEPWHAAMARAAVAVFPGAMHEPEWALLDALALGVPTIAADSPGLRELAERCGGAAPAIVPPGDAAVLQDTIAAALATRADRSAPAGPQCDSSPAGAFADALARAVASVKAADDQPAPAAPGDEAPDVSVIVTVYNLGRYLPETLASIDAQTLASREVIIVDDGSTDPETIALLGRLEHEGRRIIRQAGNTGSAAARNAGLALACGRWVVFIDADDLIDPTYLEKLAAPLRANSRLSYASTLVRCFENDDPTVTTAGWVPLGMAGFDRDLLLCMNVGGIGAGSLIDRRALLAVGGYDDRMPSYEDWELWCRLAEHGCRGVIVPEFIFSYRVRADSKYRRQGLARHAHLKSHILAHHAAGQLVSTRTLRLQFAEAAAAEAAGRAANEQLDAARAALEEARRTTGDELARRLAEAEASMAEAWRNAGNLEEMLKKTASQLAAADARAQSLGEQHAGAEARAASAAADLAAANAGIAELRARMSAMEAESARTADALAQQSAERARLEDRLDQATTQTMLTGDRLIRAHADLASAQAELAQTRQQLAALQSQLATHDCSIHTRQVLAENVRYRMVDRVNRVIRGTGVHSVAKAIARRTVAPEKNGH